MSSSTLTAAERRALVHADNRQERRPKQGEPGFVSRFHRDNLPVRLCTTACVYRANGGPGCWHFRFGKARDGELCVPEMKRLGDWSKAFQDGEDEPVRRDAGHLLGALYQRARLMLEQIDREGMTVRAPKTDRLGNAIAVHREDGTVDYVWEDREHPLWRPLMSIVRQLGMDLPEFGLTPKSKADQAPELKGKVTVNNVDVKVLVAEQAQRTKGFLRALETAARLRESDPVFQQFTEQEKGELMLPLEADE